MKSPPTMTDDNDDIFGPPRTYPTGYCPPKNRPSMISPKYRQKEERRKVLKISINKLKKIEDPEASLCRSVLINNTMKRLQREARDEKLQKQQLNYPRCYESDNFLNIKSEFIRNEVKGSFNDNQDFVDDKGVFVVENDFDAKLAQEINSVAAKNLEELTGLDFPSDNNNSNPVIQPNIDSTNNRLSSRKRSFDDMEDCDVNDVLSQFYMPPTPRMLTCIDEDEDVNVVDDEPVPKRVKVDENEQKVNVYGDVQMQMDTSSNYDKECDKNEFSVNNFNETRLRYNQNVEDTNNSYSCGHASMFSELQNNVYHNLIASLET